MRSQAVSATPSTRPGGGGEPRRHRHEFENSRLLTSSDQVTFVDEAVSTASRKNGANSGELIFPSGENRATNLAPSQTSTSCLSLSFLAVARAAASSGCSLGKYSSPIIR